MGRQYDWTDTLEVEEKFRAFHQANPQVLAKILEMISDMVALRGRRAVGINMIFEVMRWDHTMSTRGDEDFKLNNNYAPYYTRLVEKVQPELEGIITKRRSRADNL